MWAHYNEIVGNVAIPTDEMTFGGLVARYLEHLESRVAAGAMSIQSLASRKTHLLRLSAKYGHKAMLMHRRNVLGIQNSMSSTPAAADNTVKAIRAMYNWAIEAEIVETNPASNVRKIQANTNGHLPWAKEELVAYLNHHEPGTAAHIVVALALTTAARVSDLVRMGPHNLQDGVLVWLQKKTGLIHPASAPMTDLLQATLDARPVKGDTFLLTSYGKPFTWKGLPNHFRRWADEAGVHGKSLHGIRKAVGDNMAEAGATEYEIMAALGHTDPATAAIYTRRANRLALAKSGGVSLSPFISDIHRDSADNVHGGQNVTTEECSKPLIKNKNIGSMAIPRGLEPRTC